MKNELIRFRGVSASQAYASIRNLNLTVYAGEITGVLFFDDSTRNVFTKIITGEAGNVRGHFFLDGRQSTYPAIVKSQKIAYINCGMSLVYNATIADNLFAFSKERAPFSIVDTSALEDKVCRLFSEHHVPFGVRADINKLAALERTIIEVEKFYQRGCTLFYIDSLMDRGIRLNAAAVRYFKKMAELGAGFIFPAFSYESITQLCDSVYAVSSVNSFPDWRSPLFSPVSSITGRLEVPPPVPDAAYQLSFRDPALSDSTICFPLSSVTMHSIQSRPEYDSILSAFAAGSPWDHYQITGPDGRGFDRRTLKRKIVYIDSIPAKYIIEDFSPLENCCLRKFSQLGPLRVLSRRHDAFIRSQFIQWFGNQELIDKPNCRGLSLHEQIAILLFGIYLQNPSIVVCKDLSAHLDSVSYGIVRDFMQKLTRSGTSVLILSFVDKH